MNKNTILTLVFFIAAYNANSQKNLQSGYLVLNNNDTVKGSIDYKEWYKNPTSIGFKGAMQQSLTEYNKSQISAFGVIARETYKKFSVNISLDANAFNKLGDKDTANITDTVLLKVLFEGNKVSLFSYNDDIKMRFYLLQAPDKTPVELKNSSYLVNGQVANDKEYHKQLLAVARQALPGNAIVNEAINSADYSKKDLLDITNQLNGLAKNKTVTNNKISPFRFFAGLGLNRGSLQFSGDNKYAGSKPTNSYSPVIVVGVDLFFKRDVGKLFLRNSLSYSSFKSEAAAVIKYFEATQNYTFKLKQNNIAFQSQLSYNIYNQTSFKWFVGVGAAANFSSYPTNNQVLLREGLSDTSIIKTDNFIPNMRKFWLCATARTGVTIKKIDLAIAYHAKSNVVGSAAYGIDNSSWQLQLLYLFGKR